MTLLRVFSAAGAVLLAVGCTTSKMTVIRPTEFMAWPAVSPRVQLISIIEDHPSSHKISRSLHGAPESSYRPIMARPYGVAWHHEDLLVTDILGSRILRIAPNGEFTYSSRLSFASPVGIASCSSGIYVTESKTGSLWLIDDDLRKVRLIAGNLSRPTGVACVGDLVLVAETGAHRILAFDPDGKPTSIGSRGATPGTFNFPVALAADQESVWVGDTLNFRLQRVQVPSGESLAIFGELGDSPGEMPRIKGIAIHSDGVVWVTDERLDRVSLFSKDGDFFLSIGGSGGAPGQFAFPAGISIHENGRIAVVDSLNRRLQIFQMIEEIK